MASTASSWISKADARGPASHEQFGCQQRGFLSALLANSGDECMGGRISDLIKPALQHDSGCRVVTMFACPRKCCRSVISIPRASSRVAIVCRSR